MNIRFIIHSSFFVELTGCCMLFDYYEGEIPQTDKPLYVFASHSHGDHFSKDIFRLAQQGKQVHFILSSDISSAGVPDGLKDSIVFVSPHRAYELPQMKIATLKSTDQGVAFLIECEDRLIYHAGDLNCWVWDGAPRWQNSQMIDSYKEEMGLLSGRNIDLAFVPLDPRQDTDFDLGMRYFFEAAGARYVFPMHMWGDYSVVPLFKSTPTYKEYADHVMEITGPNQDFEIDI